MADFTSSFWNWFVIVLTILSIIACFWLIRWMSTGKKKPGEKVDTMGHVWDEDLAELNNPLPGWWLGLFYITLFFGMGYLMLYPGLGNFPGLLDWTSKGQYNEEMEAAKERYEPLFQKYRSQDIVTVAQDPQAVKIGERLFMNYCSTCHGSDARGARGFPNLRDNDWLWGGAPQAIETTILDGRNAVMPAWEASLGGSEGVSDVTEYVLSLSGRDHDGTAAERGKAKFDMFCVACHGADGKGNQALGAPDLTDSTWLYGGTKTSIMETIAKGRQGVMPAHREFLGEAKVHLLAAYVYSLSHDGSGG
jgi:cytochrome c oxidase cbb3-type subunit 3